MHPFLTHALMHTTCLTLHFRRIFFPAAFSFDSDFFVLLLPFVFVTEPVGIWTGAAEGFQVGWRLGEGVGFKEGDLEGEELSS